MPAGLSGQASARARGGGKCWSLSGWEGPGAEGGLLSCTAVVAPEDHAMST